MNKFCAMKDCVCHIDVEDKVRSMITTDEPGVCYMLGPYNKKVEMSTPNHTLHRRMYWHNYLAETFTLCETCSDKLKDKDK